MCISFILYPHLIMCSSVYIIMLARGRLSKRTFFAPSPFSFFFWLGKSRTHSAVHQAACFFCQRSSAYSSL